VCKSSAPLPPPPIDPVTVRVEQVSFLGLWFSRTSPLVRKGIECTVWAPFNQALLFALAILGLSLRPTAGAVSVAPKLSPPLTPETVAVIFFFACHGRIILFLAPTRLIFDRRLERHPDSFTPDFLFFLLRERLLESYDPRIEFPYPFLFPPFFSAFNFSDRRGLSPFHTSYFFLCPFSATTFPSAAAFPLDTIPVFSIGRNFLPLG